MLVIFYYFLGGCASLQRMGWAHDRHQFILEDISRKKQCNCVSYNGIWALENEVRDRAREGTYPSKPGKDEDVIIFWKSGYAPCLATTSFASRRSNNQSPR